jgi:hypothetical protein
LTSSSQPLLGAANIWWWSNTAAFQSRYPAVPAASIAGVFTGTNDGDHVVLEGGASPS